MSGSTPTAPGTDSRGPRLGVPGRGETGFGLRGSRLRGRRLRRLLAVLGVAVGVASGVGAGQDAPTERILRHGRQFAVGTFNPPARGAGTPREGTLVVHEGGYLALASSTPGGGTRAVAVPVGSTVSERGTVYVARARAGGAERSEGPVMAGHLGGPARFTGPEVILGTGQAPDLVMSSGCAAPGTRVLLVTR